MAKYREGHPIVEATQWHEEDGEMRRPGAPANVYSETDPVKGTKRFYVNTFFGLQGRAYLSDGDWILNDHEGKYFRLVKPGLFKMRYDLVDESVSSITNKER